MGLYTHTHTHTHTNNSLNNRKGISLIALIITIIIIVILAAVVISTSLTAPKTAALAKYTKTMGELQDAVSISYMDAYPQEATKATPKTKAEMYRDIASGGETPVEYTNTLPAGIEGDRAWKINNATKLNGVSELPLDYGEIYVTDTGVVFSAEGFENNGEYYVTASNKVSEIIDNGYSEDAQGQNGVNEPILSNGMIPVYYADGTWKKADKTNANDTWYKYDTSEKRWANVVTVKQTGTKTRAYYMADTTPVGTSIPEEDIIGMFVWIPRYAYKINATTPSYKYMEIRFLKGTTDKYDEGELEAVAVRGNTATTEFVVHPAFTSGTATNYKNGEWKKELTGMWVAKFEASAEETQIVAETGTDGSTGHGTNGWENYGRGTNVTVRPNVTSWRSISVSNIYVACNKVTEGGNIHGLSSTFQSHMMKNSEWGAVAYLAQSDYGNRQTSTANSGVWNNSYVEGNTYVASNGYGFYNYCTTMTGMVGESRDSYANYYSKVTSKKFNNDGTITITYENYNNTGSVTGTKTNTYSRYNTEKGEHGSTTNNIYGIYDMAGGAYEYTASYVNNGHINVSHTTTGANVVNAANHLKQVYVRNTEGIAAGGKGEQKANYDTSKANGVYGDGTTETATSHTSAYNWNGDYSDFPYSSYPWFIRGGSFGSSGYAGVFTFSYNGGGMSTGYGFRVVLCAN